MRGLLYCTIGKITDTAQDEAECCIPQQDILPHPLSLSLVALGFHPRTIGASILGLYEGGPSILVHCPIIEALSNTSSF